MEVAGTPTIRVIRHRGDLFALEGSHRLALAHSNGLVPKVIILEPDTDDALDAFFDRIRLALPAYDFDHVLALDVEKWNAEAAMNEWSRSTMDRAPGSEPGG